jgi:hypothetical protein
MDWELKDRSKKCVLCGKIFELGDGYRSALFLEDESLRKILEDHFKAAGEPVEVAMKNTGYRVELCPECWEARMGETVPDSQWLGSIFKAADRRASGSPFKRDRLEELFRNKYAKYRETASEIERLESGALAYFLAVMLERKNVLSQAPDVEDESTGIRMAVFEIAKSGERFTVPYPLLTPERIEELQDTLKIELGLAGKEQSRETAAAPDENAEKTSAKKEENP